MRVFVMIFFFFFFFFFLRYRITSLDGKAVEDRKTGRTCTLYQKYNYNTTLLVPKVIFVDVVVVVICLPVCLFVFVCFFSNKYIFKSVTAKNQIKANQTIN